MLSGFLDMCQQHTVDYARLGPRPGCPRGKDADKTMMTGVDHSSTADARVTSAKKM